MYAVSLFDLPKDDGALPAGKWVVVLWDHVTDSFPGASFVGGISVAPMDGRTVARICTFMRVRGVRRVEGDPLELGDVSAFDGASAEPGSQSAADKAPDVDSPNHVAAVADKASEDTKAKRK